MKLYSFMDDSMFMFSLWYTKHCLYDKWNLSGTNYNTHGKQIAEINFHLTTWTFQIDPQEFHNACICICIYLTPLCINRSSINRITTSYPSATYSLSYHFWLKCLVQPGNHLMFFHLPQRLFLLSLLWIAYF